MPSVNVGQLEFEGLELRDTDFVAGDDEGQSLSQGQIGEVAVLEVSEDGQSSAYDALRLGDQPDQIDSTKGRLFMTLQDGTPEALPDSTEVRFVFRDKNSNRRTPATPWKPIREMDNTDPRLRPVLKPRVRNGRPWYIKNGRILALEVKNESEQITFSLPDSSFEVPARGGY